MDFIYLQIKNNKISYFIPVLDSNTINGTARYDADRLTLCCYTVCQSINSRPWRGCGEWHIGVSVNAGGCACVGWRLGKPAVWLALWLRGDPHSAGYVVARNSAWWLCVYVCINMRPIALCWALLYTVQGRVTDTREFVLSSDYNCKITNNNLKKTVKLKKKK